MLEDGESLGAELFEASAESFNVFVVFAVATIAKSFGGVEAGFNIGFGDI